MSNPLRSLGSTVPALDSAIPEPSEDRSIAPPWGQAQRILFRFAFSYLLLCTSTYLLYFLPLPDVIVEPCLAFWDALVPRVGNALFQADTSVLPNASGDTTYNYVQVFCFLMLALAATAVWTVLDWRRPHYRRLHEGLRVYVRFALAFWMFRYGAVKVVPLQGGSLSLDRLLQPFGDSSPEGLFWTFMAASTSYKIFSGLAEMLGGLLLVFRRTALLGALVCTGVLLHVVVLNFSYDVPVKLFSSHLLAMAVFLIVPDLRRLANLLVLRPLGERKWLRWGGHALRMAFVLVFAVVPLYQLRAHKKQMDVAPKPPLHGIWNVEEFVLDGETRPPLFTDATRWQRVVFDDPRTMAILTSESRERLQLDLNPGSHLLTLAKQDDPRWGAALSYQRFGPQLLAMEGTFDGHKIRARLRRIDEPRFRLVSRRGFHWIHEYHYSR